MIGSRYQPFFQGIPTFFRAPLTEPTALTAEDVAVIGVPFDAGITLGRQGAKHGPRSIREASCYYASLYDCTPEKAQYHIDNGLVQTVTSEQRFKDLGDLDVFPLDVAATTDAIVEGVASAARNAGFTLVLGGDHYVAYPSFKGFVKGIRSRQPDASFGYVHVDSHTDFWDEYGFGGRYNHATAVRRITEEGLVDRDRVVWLGLNGMMPLEHHRLMVKHHMTALTASQLTEASWKQRLDDAIRLFRDVDYVYVSLDIDVVNGADAPGTGAAVFEGIDAKRLLGVLDALSRIPNLGAIDVCEVSPPLDVIGRTERLAATALLTVVGSRVFLTETEDEHDRSVVDGSHDG